MILPSPSDAAAILDDRQTLRREMRTRRRALTDTEREAAATALARVISRRGLLQPGRRVAVYLTHRSEMDLSRVIAMARQRKCKLYLPAIIHAGKGSMEFVRFGRDQPLRRNHFGILEPALQATARIAPMKLDLVLLPLVAVDACGWRLGSGAGFYDRRLSHLRHGRRWRRPKLIGIAYDFQRVPAIEQQWWDVPLDAVVTDRDFYPSRLHRSFEPGRAFEPA